MAAGQEVFTSLGKGRIVYCLGDGSLVVEFPHGGGQVFRKEELFLPAGNRDFNEGRKNGEKGFHR